jgi:uncharacterized Tic20 family protein
VNQNNIQGVCMLKKIIINAVLLVLVGLFIANIDKMDMVMITQIIVMTVILIVVVLPAATIALKGKKQ